MPDNAIASLLNLTADLDSCIQDVISYAHDAESKLGTLEHEIRCLPPQPDRTSQLKDIEDALIALSVAFNNLKGQE